MSTSIKLTDLTELLSASGSNTILYCADLSVSPNVSHYIRVQNIQTLVDYTIANAAFARANTAYSVGFNANTALNISAVAFDQANAAYGRANTAVSIGFNANTALVDAAAAFLRANAAFAHATSGFNHANASFTRANSATITAQASFDTANTKLTKTGDTIAGIVLAPTATPATTSNTMLATTAFVQNAITSAIGSTVSGFQYVLKTGDAISGVVTAPTADVLTSNTMLATTAFVQNVITNRTPSLASYVVKTGDTITGIVNAPTAATSTSNTMLATTAFVQNAISANAPNLSGFLQKSGDAITGVVTAPTAGTSTSNTMIATTAFVKNAINAAITAIPTGVIVMWSGSIVSVPSGWYLCDGTNGTPDLRDRFIVGAGNTYSPGGTGGSKDAIVVSHTHSALSTFSGSPLAAHTHVVNDSGHRHMMLEGTPDFSGDQKVDRFDTLSNSATNQSTISGTQTATTGITLGSTSGGTPSGSVSTSINSTGSNGANANLPPYYALAFIMKG